MLFCGIIRNFLRSREATEEPSFDETDQLFYVS